VAGDWRSKADKARDAWRHPAQTLAFWGLKPGQTVVEFWPGAGWYTDILAPYLAANGGKLYAAQFQTGPGAPPAETELMDAYARKLAAMPALYGQPTFTAFGASSGPAAPAGGADLVIFARVISCWMAAGIAEKAFRDAFAALKPGGVLGVEENRAASGGVQDVLAASGYVQEAYVKRLAQEAGFTFDGASEINANPKDTKSYPFGVWTLPPWRQSAPKGKPDDPRFDHAKYDAVGESDRMTLRFVKPR
jgi:predicted methyltransferase